MENIKQNCEPRKDLLKGTFNPEIFTASLSQVLGFYRGDTEVDNIYTNAQSFFEEATYATDGMRQALFDVFGRLNGDNSLPAIHRLETAFGGGKTHTLIACTHLAFKGKELAENVSGIVDESLLHDPGNISVVGIAGDEIPVHTTKGKKLVPYTLWGEIAYQIGGKELYEEVEEEAKSPAAPGKPYFETVFGERKVLIMLDELAQYAARLDAAHSNGASQLAAFLMGLHGYARNHKEISILLTLASAADAFATQTERLRKLITQVRGAEVTQDEAVSIGDRASKDIQSVVSRDATPVTPVQATEISSILGKRLFSKIDHEVARDTAEEYAKMYSKNSGMLPDEATRNDYQERMVAHYPFHPTFIDFLNNKLSTVENFQGTRGVLRVLARAVRSLWESDVTPPMIHTCHLDMRDPGIVGEILGRTGSGDLAQILNADVGGVDTGKLESGRSNAELADLRNPHPAGFPMYEYTWKTVFLHSLVGRDQALGSDIFGLTEQNALFQISFPGLTPAQVLEALKEISRTAFYLRNKDGRYFGSLEPSINIALAKISRSLSNEQVMQLLDATARKIIRPDIKTFDVVVDVSAPEHIPDGKGKPILAVIKLDAESIDVEACVTTKGPNTPRVEQNLVFMLAPDTVQIERSSGNSDDLFSSETKKAEELLGKLQNLGRSVMAMRILKEKPQDYGIRAAHLAAQDFDARYKEREQALVTQTTQAYCNLWYPSATGQIQRKDTSTAGGEGGASTIELIRAALLEEDELVTSAHTEQSHLQNLRVLFFDRGDTVSVETIATNFRCRRKWPILEDPDVLEQILRAGVAAGQWCIFKMGNAESTLPEPFFSRDKGEVPLNVDITKGQYSLVAMEGARQRGWMESNEPAADKVTSWVKGVVAERQSPLSVNSIHTEVKTKYGEAPDKAVDDAVSELVRTDKMMCYKGKEDADEKPDNLMSGTDAILYTPSKDDIIISKSEAARRGWIKKASKKFELNGTDGARKLMPILRQIGSAYSRGATSKVDHMDLAEMKLEKGGRLRVTLSDVPPESMQRLGELFEVLDGLVESDGQTIGEIEISDPDDNCPFIQKLRTDDS